MRTALDVRDGISGTLPRGGWSVKKVQVRERARWNLEIFVILVLTVAAGLDLQLGS